MACGCPVVTSDVSAMPEIAGGAAVLCDPHDPASIGQAIVEAAGGKDKLRPGGIERASHFTWADTATSLLDLYREVYERRKARKAR
jgi:glycosyltransferase involved in cell wall biosynthesis